VARSSNPPGGRAPAAASRRSYAPAPSIPRSVFLTSNLHFQPCPPPSCPSGTGFLRSSGCLYHGFLKKYIGVPPQWQQSVVMPCSSLWR
jgi:hypothetical protein